MTWGNGILLDKRFCQSCRVLKQARGGTWVITQNGRGRYWRCGACDSRRQAILDSYEQTDATAACCDIGGVQ